MAKLPVNEDARARLRAAQLDEIKALRGVEAAQAGYAKALAALHETDNDLRDAKSALIHTSGVERAALLLGVTPTELQRAAKAATQANDSVSIRPSTERKSRTPRPSPTISAEITPQPMAIEPSPAPSP